MNGQFFRIFLILSLAILAGCLPAQAAQGGQSGSSSELSDHGTPADTSSGLSAGTASDSGSESPEIDTGSSISSPSLVQGEPDVTTSGNAQNSLSPADKIMQAGLVNTKAGPSSSADQSGESSGRSDTSRNGRTETAGGMVSPQRTGGENGAGIPDTQGQNKESGRLTGSMLSPVSAAATGSPSGSGNPNPPVPGSGHGSSSQQHKHWPPAQSGTYPCGPAQASPLPSSSVQIRDESKEDTLSRQRSKRAGFLSRILDPVVSDPAPSSFPPSSFFPLTMLLIGGFRRISKKNVLEHYARQVIYQTITSTPGIDVKTLAGLTGVNENTLRYHLDRLAATGKISCFTRPGVVRYFQNQGTYNRYEHLVFHYLWTATPREILGLLYQHPGLTRQHIADTLAISGPSITRQMDSLIEDGIVENRFPGRSNHYYLTAEAALTINKLMGQAPVVMHSRVESCPMSAITG